jgi:hypothetical protein
MLIVIVATSIWFGFLLGVVSMALLACSKPELQGACVRPASALGSTLVLDRRLPPPGRKS